MIARRLRQASPPLVLTSNITAIRPPEKRRIFIRLALFFLAAASLAWPITLIVRSYLLPLHPSHAAAIEYQTLPPAQSSRPAGNSSGRKNSDFASMQWFAVALQLALVAAFGLSLHKARAFNQKIWGPAFERWSASWYCNNCHQVFIHTTTKAPIPALGDFRSRNSNISPA